MRTHVGRGLSSQVGSSGLGEDRCLFDSAELIRQGGRLEGLPTSSQGALVPFPRSSKEDRRWSIFLKGEVVGETPGPKEVESRNSSVSLRVDSKRLDNPQKR